MAESPWSAPHSGDPSLNWEDAEREPPDKLARVAGILNLCFAPLELLWAGFSLMSLGMFATMAWQPSNSPQLEAIQPHLTLFITMYTVMLLAAVIAAIGHLAAGVSFLTRRPSRPLIWASLGVGVASLATIYCAPLGIVSSILALVWLTRPAPAQAGADS